MAAGDPREKREQPRIARRLPVQFGTAGQMRGGVAVDISAGGLRVAAREIFPIHSLLDVLVQFPTHAVRLRARVTWTGASGEPDATRAMGLVFTRPEPSLAGAYHRWLDELKVAMAEERTAGTSAAVATTSAAVPAPAAPAASRPAAPEPTGPVTRRLESPQGRTYEVLLEPLAVAGWRLTVVQIPRQLGVDGTDFAGSYRDYASADAAMREFVRSH